MEEAIMPLKPDLIIICGSAGSLEVLLEVLPGLRPGLDIPLVVVLHRKAGTDSALTQLIAARTSLKVLEAEEKDPILPGHLYIAPADYHLLFEQDHTFALDDSERVNYSRPSLDVSLESASLVYGAATAALLLSGANADGVEGLKRVQQAGGYIAVQDPASAQVPYMPQQALDALRMDAILAPNAMAAFINTL
jgi:two-component system chemotaxis response regulator CheB